MSKEGGTRGAWPEGAEQVIDAMRARALEMWGRERTEAIDPTLHRTAMAVWKLSSLEFEISEPPAFYLDEFDDVVRDGRLPITDDDE